MKLSEIKIQQVQEDEIADQNKPIELKDLIEYFPGTYEKALRKLWGSSRLVFHGMKFFDGDSLGEAYVKAEQAVKEAIEDDFKVEVSIPLEGGEDLNFEEFSFEAAVEKDFQECYLGYSPKQDALFIGIDASLSEDDFNSAWDEEFEKATGQEYDHENEEHAHLFNQAWKYWTSSALHGILFDLDLSGDDFHAEPYQEAQSGFYRGIYNSSAFKSLGLIDIRLD